MEGCVVLSHQHSRGSRPKVSFRTHIKAVAIAHQCVMEQVPIDLGFDEDQVDEQHDKVVLDILVAEATAFTADSQTDVVPARLVPGARIRGP